MALKEIC